jgi:hypothetical protein
MEKMRLYVSLLASVAVFFAVSTASAVEFVVLNGPGADLSVGDEVTIQIRIRDAVGVFGLGASVFGYDEGVADFAAGDAVGSYLNPICVPGAGCFNGLTNLAGGALSESAIGANGNRVQIGNSAGLSAVTAVGDDNPGLDGVIGGGGSQFNVTFRAVGLGSTTLSIGTGYQGDVVVLAGGVTEQATNGSFTINVIPEPGTALLMGLGLVGLATAGRRK